MPVRPECAHWNLCKRALRAVVLCCGNGVHDHVQACLGDDFFYVCERARQRLVDLPTELHDLGVVILRQDL